MLRLVQDVEVHPHGSLPPAPLKRYSRGTPVDQIAETEGWQLCDEHFYDDAYGHPTHIVEFWRRNRDTLAGLGIDTSDLDALIASAEAAPTEEVTADAAR